MIVSVRPVVHSILCAILLVTAISSFSPAAENAVLFSEEEQLYLKNKKEITVCIDPDWLPLEALVDGHHVGMTAEYMELFSKIIGIPIRLLATKSWSESIEFARQRKCDIFSLAMATPERETYMTFTSPYLQIPLVMAAKIDTPFIDDISTLTDKKIGMVHGYAFNELLRKRYPQMQIVNVESVGDGLDKVVHGKIFGFIGTLATVGYLIQKDFTGELKVSGKFDERWNLGIGARNDEPLLTQIFNKAIHSLDPAKQQEILNHWIAVRFEQGINYSLLLNLAPYGRVLFLAVFHRFLVTSKAVQNGHKTIMIIPIKNG